MKHDVAAIIDPAHRSFVNFEIYYFSDEPSKQTFDKDPRRHCGIITDPVSQERFTPGDETLRFDYGGRPYYFLSAETLEQFKTLPDSFSVPRYTMRDM